MSGESTVPLPDLIAALAQPDAYPYSVDHVEVRQTHISLVLLAGPWVFKIKKPVHLPFLDFSSLERRYFFCQEEVRINGPLAPDVYQGVVPIRKDANGIHFGGEGVIVEWAVQMERLPNDVTLDVRLRSCVLTKDQVTLFARRVAQFHQAARRDTQTARWGRFSVIAKSVRENLDYARTQHESAIAPCVLDQLHQVTERSLASLGDLIDQRASAGFVRELHGDLHLDHVYLFEDREPPRDLLMIDAIEFNEAFRCIDVVADMAFCVMDFEAHSRRDLGRHFAETYFAATGDAEGRVLLPLFASYRAAVRAKVNGMLANEVEVSDADRKAALDRSAAFWLLAWGLLAEPNLRPALLLVSGLPGTGKSVLARRLGERANFEVVRSDVVRKELAAVSCPAAANYGDGLYSSEWNDRTYSECLRRTELLLRSGKRVIVDATFSTDSRRKDFLNLANRLCVPVLWLLCEASEEAVHRRLDARRGDASDANWSIYQQAAEHWEVPQPQTQQALRAIDSNGSPDEVLAQVHRLLIDEALANPN